MPRLSYVLAPAIVAGTMIVGLSTAKAAEPTTQPSDDVAALKAQVQALESKVNALENKQAETQADVTASVQAVLQDADRHSQSLDVDAADAGFDPQKGAFLRSDDGNFYLHPGFIFQFRGAADYRDHGKAIHSQDDTTGFEVRRAKFEFDGYIGSPDLTYKFQWQDGNNGGTPTLEYGWGQDVIWHNVFLGGNVAIRAGQFKNPVFKEEAGISDTNQLMVERSMANSLVGGLATSSGNALVQGVDILLCGDNTPLHVDAGYSDGDASGNTDFTNNRDVTTATAPVAPTNDSAYARADWKAFGDWTDTTDLTGKNSGKHDLLDIGGGLDYSDQERSTSVGGSQSVRGTIDAQYLNAKSWTIYAALYGDHYDFRNPEGGQNNWGAVIEGGYFWTPAVELTAEYSLVRLDPAFPNEGRSIFHDIGAGVDYYLGEGGALANHAKLSADVNWEPRGTPSGLGGLDYQSVPNGKSAVVVRGQFQIYY